MLNLIGKFINSPEGKKIFKKVKDKNTEIKKKIQKIKKKLLQFQKITIQEKEYQHLYLINLIY
jgi:biotin synthase-related radical SAM superfamily protein